MTKFSDNDSPSLLFTEQGSTPSTPAASHQRLFVRSSDHLLCFVNSSGTVTPIGSGLSDPMTTRGDIIIRDASNVTARLAIGSSGKVLSSNGTDVSWQTPSSGGLTQAYAGYNTIGGTAEDVVDLRQYMKKITLANDCLVSDIEVYIKQKTAGEIVALSVGLLDDAAGAPGKVIGLGQSANASSGQSAFLSTSNGSAGAARWLGMPLGYWAVAGDYWLAVCIDIAASASHQVFKDGSGGDRYYTNGAPRITDSGWTTVTTSTDRYSIRANTIR